MMRSIALQQLSNTGRRLVLRLGLRSQQVCQRAVRRAGSGPTDRGDVPGWVLVTIMTAGLVVALWAVAGPKLTDLFTNAVDSVQGQ